MTRRQTRSGLGAQAGDGALLELDGRLLRERARAQRAWRAYRATSEKIDPAASAEAHQSWSNAVDDALRTVEAISVTPAQDLQGLLIKYEAAWWWIREDDHILDSSARRWLGRFGRNLRRLVSEG